MRDSSGTPAGLMAEQTPSDPQERRFDPLVWAAGGLFLLAIAFGSAPAWRAGPDTLAGLLLLVGLAGVALLGLMAFRGAATPIEVEDDGVESFIEALPEAAAVAGADGRVLAANGPWRSALG
ncbi:MAG TPA: hybrid sensor histidine kinase/response regulator, partial [Caulobacter sp.]|nr:hybrid sensor histidine kinase/response regulator [Caulobacter sp.]